MRTAGGRVLDTSALRTDVRMSYLWAVPSAVLLTLGVLVARIAHRGDVSLGAWSIPLLAILIGVLGLGHNAWVRRRARRASQRLVGAKGTGGRVVAILGNVPASRFLRVYLDVGGEERIVPLVTPRGGTLPGVGQRVRCYRNGRTMAVVDGDTVHWSF